MYRKLRTSLVSAAAAALLLSSAGLAAASDVDIAVVDVSAPTGAVSVAAGGSATITINASVSGNQDGTATFEVYRDWTLSGGGFTGSRPQEFTVAPRTGGAPATTFSTSGTVTVAAGQSAGTFALEIGVFDITNTNDKGGKLQAGRSSSYQVTVTSATPPPPPANTPPAVEVTGFTDGATVEIGTTVPSPGCSVVDAEDAGESATPVVDTSGVDAHGLGTVTVTCSYTDTGTLPGSDSKSYTLVDTIQPGIIASVAPINPESTGWYTSAPTVTFSCTDSPGSGVQSCVADDASPASPSLTLGESATAQSVSGTATDWAGNKATTQVSGLHVDVSDPYDVAFAGGPAADASYYFGEVPAKPACTAKDDVSGFDTCEVTGHSTAVGSHTMTATATDNAGRTATTQRSYIVKAWTGSGFYSPVDLGGTVNTVKGGSTVPLKFELFAGPTELTDVARIQSFLVTKSTCAPGAQEDAIEMTATGGTSLRYDTTGGQFIQNWKTPSGAGVCYTVTMTAADETTTLSAKFKTK